MKWIGGKPSTLALTGLIEMARVRTTVMATANMTTTRAWERFIPAFLLHVLTDRARPQKILSTDNSTIHSSYFEEEMTVIYSKVQVYSSFFSRYAFSRTEKYLPQGKIKETIPKVEEL